MNIGEASKISGISAKLIRHYESIGLIPKAKRTNSGYRNYAQTDVHMLCFVQRSRNLGFSMKEIKKLVNLWMNPSRASSEVKALTVAHIKNLEQKIKDLQTIRSSLQVLAKSCHGDNRPSCPILKDLSGLMDD